MTLYKIFMDWLIFNELVLLGLLYAARRLAPDHQAEDHDRSKAKHNRNVNHRTISNPFPSAGTWRR